MPVDIVTLEPLALFAELTPEELEDVRGILRTMKVAEAEIIARKGAAAHLFFIILSGNFMVAFDEDRAITLHNSGDIMGWSAVFTPFRYKGTVLALTAGAVLAMPGEEFLSLTQDNPALGDKIMKKINATASERMSFVKEPDNEGFF